LPWEVTCCPQKSCQTSFPPKVDVQGKSSLTSNVAMTQIVEIICKTSLQFRSFTTFNQELEPQTTSSTSASALLAKALTVMLQRDAASSQCCVDSAWPGQSDGKHQLHKQKHDLLCSHNTLLLLQPRTVLLSAFYDERFLACASWVGQMNDCGAVMQHGPSAATEQSQSVR